MIGIVSDTIQFSYQHITSIRHSQSESTSMATLPQALSTTAYVDITLIPAGSMRIPDYTVHENGTEEDIICPDYAFLIEHKALGKKAFFDLGIPKVQFSHTSSNCEESQHLLSHCAQYL